MTTSLRRATAPADNAFLSATEVRPISWRDVTLGELEQTLRAALSGTQGEAGRPVAIASAQRDDRYAAVAFSGHLDRSAVRAMRAHLRGLLDAGSHCLVVDLSQVAWSHEVLLSLLRAVEAAMTGRGGVFEVTGLSPRLLYDMDDELVSRVFALHRAAFETADPAALSWAAMRCPVGLDEVAEPRTARRHRAIIDRSGRR